MKQWKPTHTMPIGLDLGTRQIKAAQLAHAGGQYSLLAAAILERPLAPEADGRILDDLTGLLRRQGFRGKSVVVACPQTMLRTDVLELPPRSSGAPIDQIARTEMKRSGRFEEAPFEMSYWDLPNTGRAGACANVMAVAASEADTGAILDQVENLGFDVAAIDTMATALARACGMTAENDVGVIVDLGATAAIVVLSHRGRVLYERPIADSGLDLVYRSIEAELGLGDSEITVALTQVGLASEKIEVGGASSYHRTLRLILSRHLEQIGAEVQASIAYAAHRYPSLNVTRVMLCGGGAQVAGIASHLSAEWSVPVQLATTTGELSSLVIPGEEPRRSLLVNAIGLSLNGGD